MRCASLTIHKEEFSFSAGHFTIFSATEREQLHGHNYSVSVSFKFNIEHNGLSFDYRHYKKKILALCDQLDRHFLLPSQSPYLQVEAEGDYWIAHFNQKKIPFLKEDVILLPLTNITIEELSHWFLQQIIAEQATLPQHAIHGITVEVYNGPGQSAGASIANMPFVKEAVHDGRED
ncbi:MAG: 6-pyruvoyl tetrahydrobiopterin synthase [Gammaproteobacteria bacterium]|nr:MAG: 6-pyruvoyl tetrahydrobiopterin synthase [Gammaproteobacteria bacterium]